MPTKLRWRVKRFSHHSERWWLFHCRRSHHRLWEHAAYPFVTWFLTRPYKIESHDGIMHQHTKIDFTITYTGKGKPAIIVKFLCMLRYEDYIGAVVIVIAYMELYRARMAWTCQIGPASRYPSPSMYNPVCSPICPATPATIPHPLKSFFPVK